MELRESTETENLLFGIKDNPLFTDELKQHIYQLDGFDTAIAMSSDNSPGASERKIQLEKDRKQYIEQNIIGKYDIEYLLNIFVADLEVTSDFKTPEEDETCGCGEFLEICEECYMEYCLSCDSCECTEDEYEDEYKDEW